MLRTMAVSKSVKNLFKADPKPSAVIMLCMWVLILKKYFPGRPKTLGAGLPLEKKYELGRSKQEGAIYNKDV